MLNVPGLNFRDSLSLPSDVNSDDILRGLQNTFGVQKYNQQSVSRQPFFSYTAYPLAGATRVSFFSQAQSAMTQQFTNITNANTLSNESMLISSISFDVMLWLPTVTQNGPWPYALDADNPYSDLVHGFTQGGYSQLTINNTCWDECDLPFMWSPAAIGKNRMEVATGLAGAQNAMSPFEFTGSSVSLCFADIERRFWRRRNLKNKIFLAPQTSFDLSIFYDFGVLPVIGTTAITNAANPPTGPAIMVGARFDGLRYSPLS